MPRNDTTIDPNLNILGFIPRCSIPDEIAFYGVSVVAVPDNVTSSFLDPTPQPFNEAKSDLLKTIDDKLEMINRAKENIQAIRDRIDKQDHTTELLTRSGTCFVVGSELKSVGPIKQQE